MPRSSASNLRPSPILPRPSAAPEAKTPSHEMTWKEKEALLEKFDEWSNALKALGVKKPSISLFERQFASKNQVSRLLKQREKLKDLQAVMPENAADSRRRIMTRPSFPVECLLQDWLEYYRQRLIPVHNEMLRQVAEDVYRAWIIDNGPLRDNKGNEPTWSSNWAQKFIKAWNLTSHNNMRGEIASVSWDQMKDEVQEIMVELDQYQLEDIYNCDETGLYLRWLSNWTLNLVKTSGVKPGRCDRVSVLLCSNATGTDKRKPFIQSEHFSLSLSELTSIQVETQPPNENRVGYMRQEIFANWLRRFQADIVSRSPERKILLLLDNTPGRLILSQPNFLAEIPNIRIVTLPKNSCSVTQPLDAGIISVFKQYYQDFLAISTMAHCARNPQGQGIIDNKTAWKHIVQAWNLVKPQAILNCFGRVPLFSERHKAGLSASVEGSQEVEIALRRIQISIAQIEANREPMEGTTVLRTSEVQAVVDEVQTEILARADSFVLWSDHADDEDRAVFEGRHVPPLPVLHYEE